MEIREPGGVILLGIFAKLDIRHWSGMNSTVSIFCETDWICMPINFYRTMGIDIHLVVCMTCGAVLGARHGPNVHLSRDLFVSAINRSPPSVAKIVWSGDFVISSCRSNRTVPW